MKTQSIMLSLLIFSCSSRTELTKDQLEVIKQSTITEIKNARATFINAYFEKARVSIDYIEKKQLQILYHSVENTNSYMDSLKSEMFKLDERGIKSKESINSNFINNGMGDSLFDKINFCINAAQNATTSKKTSTNIKAAHDSLFDKPKDQWTNQLFRATSPSTVSMIIYGLQSELYRICTEALKE